MKVSIQEQGNKEYPSPRRHWKSMGALKYARDNALRIARDDFKQRYSSGAPPRQLMSDLHLGHEHVSFFINHLESILNDLPRGFYAIEIGAGTGIHAALLAAHGAGNVVATEYSWDDTTPHSAENAHTMYRLTQLHPALNSVYELVRDSSLTVTGVRFSPILHFVCADGRSLPFPDEITDFAYTINCLEHIHDLSSVFGEIERIVKFGGSFFASAQPLFFSAYGHHLADIFPLPWGHLLWERDELIDLVMKETDITRGWRNGNTLTRNRVEAILDECLNYVTPAEIRNSLRKGTWRVKGWSDITCPEDESLAREIRLFDAIKGIPAENIFLVGIHFHLQKVRSGRGIRLALRTSHIIRHRYRPLINFIKGFIRKA